MGKKVVLMRHSKAHQAVDGQRDHSRKLNDKGLERARKIARALQPLIDLEWAWVSDAARTVETYKILADELQLHQNHSGITPSLYLSDEDAYIGEIRSTPEQVNNAILIGHDPTISWLSQACAAKNIEPLATGSTVVFEIAIDHWADFHPSHCSMLHYLNAKTL